MTIHLSEIELPVGLAKSIWPNSYLPGQRYLAVYINNNVAMTLAIDFPPDVTSVMLHIDVPKDMRSKKNFIALQQGFKDLLIPWVLKQGRDSIVVCITNEPKIKRFVEGFGFTEPEPIYFYIMSLKGE